MRRLIEKYPRGYEGYLMEKGLDAHAINADSVGKNAEIEATVIQALIDSPDAPVVTAAPPVAEVTVQSTE